MEMKEYAIALQLWYIHGFLTGFKRDQVSTSELWKFLKFYEKEEGLTEGYSMEDVNKVMAKFDEEFLKMSEEEREDVEGMVRLARKFFELEI